MADCNCVLVVLPQDYAALINLPDDVACCCEEPAVIVPGIFYDGTFFYDGIASYTG